MPEPSLLREIVPPVETTVIWPQAVALSNVIDAVLLDLNVPELAGLDVYRELKRLRPQVRVLVVSGHITKELRSELTKLGQRDFIAKPYRLDEICERLRIVLDEV